MQHNTEKPRVTFDLSLNEYIATSSVILSGIKNKSSCSLSELKEIQDNIINYLNTQTKSEFRELHGCNNEYLQNHIMYSFIDKYSEEIATKEEYFNLFKSICDKDFFSISLIERLLAPEEQEDNKMYNFLLAFVAGENLTENEVKLNIKLNDNKITKEQFQVLKIKINIKAQELQQHKKQKETKQEEKKSKKSKSWFACFGCGSKKDVNIKATQGTNTLETLFRGTH
jgi:hypothetical protein